MDFDVLLKGCKKFFKLGRIGRERSILELNWMAFRNYWVMWATYVVWAPS